MGSPRTLIAVVDDEEPVRIALRRLLRSADLDVDTFASGADFIDSLETRTPDCVVLDLQMPQVDGFAVQRHLATAEGRPPVVVITGHDSEEAREQAHSNGASAYLRKPVDGGRLLQAIAAAISGARSGRHV
jgi:FixJ family two-component response regulator